MRSHKTEVPYIIQGRRRLRPISKVSEIRKEIKGELIPENLAATLSGAVNQSADYANQVEKVNIFGGTIALQTKSVNDKTRK